MDTKVKVRKKKVYSGNFCQVPGCSNQSGKDKFLGISRKYHRFPAKTKATLVRRRAWLRAIPRDAWSPKKNDRICSDHFVGGSASHTEGRPGYIPTILKGADKARRKISPKKRVSKTSTQSSEFVIPKAPFVTPKQRQRKRKSMNSSATPASTGRHLASKRLHSEMFSNSLADGISDHDYIKTTSLHYVQSQVECLHTQLEAERATFKARLKEMENKIISINSVKNFRLWTNFPNRAMFDALVTYLKSRGAEQLKYWKGGATSFHKHHADRGINKPGPDRKFSFEEELFMVVVKLKSGLNNTELAQLFGMSDTAVSQIVTTLINFLASELKILFEMSPLEEEDVASCFRPWENLKVVLDCTELACEKTSLTARKQLYSNYKGKDTVKFAVSLGRNLCVNYVSKAYGGRASEKFITLDSQDMLQALPEGTKVMTDRGFNVGKELSELGVELIIPVFKGRGRTQMTEKELTSSENIAMARIHVERIIQRIRTYQILEKNS